VRRAACRKAIALRDEATAARLLEDGAGVDEIGLIRAGIISSQPILATPLEAAILVDSATAVEYMKSRGARLPPDLSCLARDIGARVRASADHRDRVMPGWQGTAGRPRPTMSLLRRR
jgi:hypothetical protein